VSVGAGVTPGPAIAARQERRDFVKAFREHAWARPGSARRHARPQIVVMVAAGAAAVAVVVGVVLQLIHPVRLAKAVEPVAAPAGAGYAAVTGWDCGFAADHGFLSGGRNAGWYTVASGGWTRDGCHGTFASLPMSGKADVDDSGQFAQWWFTPGSEVARCAVAVYVPRGDHPTDAGATAAVYHVLSAQNGTPMAQFTVNQSTAAGQWVAAGEFPVVSGAIAIQLGNRGVPASGDARLAIAQLRVTCPGGP
jgi:hypothetical protein